MGRVTTVRALPALDPETLVTDILDHTVTNINPEAMLLSTKAIAHAVATYARDFATLPARSMKREADVIQKGTELRK